MEASLLSELSEQIPTIAQLSDDEALRISFVDIMAFEYVGMVE